MSKPTFKVTAGMVCLIATIFAREAVAQSATALTFIPGSSVKLEQILGDCDWQVKAKDGSCFRTASQTATRYNIQGTDIGSSFEQNGKVIFLFGDTISQDTSVVNYQAGDSIAWSTSTDADAPMLLNFYANNNGTPLFVRPAGINMGGNNVPNSGISLSDGTYLLCNVGADSATHKPSDRSILVRFDENARTFTAVRTVSSLPGHFINGSMHKSGTDVLVFGAGNYRASDIYLSTTPANSFAAGTGTRYFAGLLNGQPNWSTAESDAVPVIQDNPLNGPAWPNDAPSVGNLSVAYSEELKLWLITYDGGRQASTTRGVYFTYAQQPWGPWAMPQLIFNDVRDNAYGSWIHNPAIMPNPPGDGLNGPTIGNNDPFTTPGGTYAPLLIERFTRVVGDTLKIYFVMSTWNPYTIVRMRTEFKITTANAFRVSNQGGVSLTSSGASGSVLVGYGRIQPDSGATAPAGIAIFGYRNNNVLVSEVAVPAVAALNSGRFHAEIAGAVNAGLAVVNPNATAATLNFVFTDTGGNFAGSGTITVPANQQIAQFLNQSPFNVYRTSTFQGTFSFTSNLPVAVVALRGFTNERGDFLMSTLPVIDTLAAPNNGIVVVPQYADGGGWSTQLLLVNPTENPISGTVQFLDANGAVANVAVVGQTGSSFSYSIPRRASQKLVTAGLSATTLSGSVRISPTGDGVAPTPLIVFSYKPAGVTVSEAGVPVVAGSAFRLYVESSGVTDQVGSIQSGIAVANTSSASGSVTFEITNLNGTPVTGIPLVTIALPTFAQTARFLSDIFPSLPKPFKGTLHITASMGISVVGLRTRINERGEFLITTTPAANENTSAGTAEMFFPQVADGGGFTTQFILFSASAGRSTSGILKLVKQDGSAVSLTLN